MSKKVEDFLTSFLAFILMILVLGVLMPEYFSGVAKFIMDNLVALFFLALLAVFLYLLTQLGRR